MITFVIIANFFIIASKEMNISEKDRKKDNLDELTSLNNEFVL